MDHAADEKEWRHIARIRYANFMAQFKQFAQERGGNYNDRGMLADFAKRLDLTARYLSHVKCGRKAIGNNTARKIEEALQLNPGWLDMAHEGNLAVDDAEQLFLETALTLYRSNPQAARVMMNDVLRAQLTKSPVR